MPDLWSIEPGAILELGDEGTCTTTGKSYDGEWIPVRCFIWIGNEQHTVEDLVHRDEITAVRVIK